MPSKRTERWFGFVALIAVLCVICLWLLNLSLGVAGLLIATPTGAGTFGDMFGSVNALFSGLAFAGVILAIFMQRDELSLQRQELEATRSELRATRQISATNSILRDRYLEARVLTHRHLREFRYLRDAIQHHQLLRQTNPNDWDAKSRVNQDTEENAVAYESAIALERVGSAVVTGELSVDSLLSQAAGKIVQDWLLCVKHIKSLQESKADDFPPRRTASGIYVSLFRAHADWIAGASALWLYQLYDSRMFKQYLAAMQMNNIHELKAFVREFLDLETTPDSVKEEINGIMSPNNDADC
jgi:hypothetical protein